MNILEKHPGNIALIGRVFLAAIFIVSGLSKIPTWDSNISYMTEQGIPLAPVLLFPAIFIEVIGGLCLLIGLRTKMSAALLFLYLIPVSILLHSFWKLGGMDRQIQLINFMKNLAIMGGLLVVAAFGPGTMSLDYLIRRKKSGSPESRREKIKIAS